MRAKQGDVRESPHLSLTLSAPKGGEVAARKDSQIESDVQDVAVGDDVVGALEPHAPRLFRPLLAAAGDEVGMEITSARMNPFSKSVWIAPAACGALVPWATVQACASLGPMVKKVMRSRRR
jgi:hypothetical protein